MTRSTAAAPDTTGPVDPAIGGWRGSLAAWLDRPIVQRSIMAVILVNAITLGLETSATVMDAAGPTLRLLDQAALAVFVAELTLKLVAHGPRFFRSGWNWFDLIVVGLTVLPMLESLSVLRAFRILRLFRLFSMVPSMRRIVAALFLALPGMASVMAVLAVMFYVAAVMAAKLFGAAAPELFGTLGASLFTLFQVMTLEGWAGDVVRPLMNKHPLAWLFFLPFILVTTFAVLNLFVGLIVNAMQELGTAKAVLSTEEQILAEVKALRAEVAALRGDRSDRDGA